MFDSSRADTFFASVGPSVVVPYMRYWANLIPKTRRDVWLRWVFAFMSVHTSWRNNVKGYLAVKTLPVDFSKEQLAAAVITSGVGLHGMRIRGLWDFTTAFGKDPGHFDPNNGETMVACRDRLADSLFGIGMAKTSFALELVYPMTGAVVCLDTHILRLYQHQGKGSPSAAAYRDVERHWLAGCSARGVPSPLARHVYWDRLQGENDNRYWAWCLEPEKGATHATAGTAI